MSYEYVGNMHMHTPFSDGEAYHDEIAAAAQRAKLDFVIVTDHNIYVDGVQGYYGDDSTGYVLLLTGEEVHDRRRLPQVNHCLVYNVGQSMSKHAHNPQQLLNAVQDAGGLTFLAHPFDRQIHWYDDVSAIDWVTWDIESFHGLEIWNYMSVFKDVLTSPLTGFRRIFEPEQAMIGPRPETLAKWDELLATGRRVVGIGNADAHGKRYKLGPIQQVIFPYDFLFQCVNTHILTDEPFSGYWQQDAALIYRSLRNGTAFISYDLVADAHGFKFSAQGIGGAHARMGECIALGNSVTLQVIAPQRGHIRLIHHGEILAEGENVENLTYNVTQRGAYRAEVWRDYKGLKRCWILSNPIYVE
jgi:hypothetical protein